MSLVYACVAPHGGEILPELAPEPGFLAATRAAMRRIARECREARPDLIVVATPHNLRLEGPNAVVTAEWASGSLGPVHMEVRLDPAFARAWTRRAAEAGVPVVACNFGALEGPASRVPLDWGALIPLYFTREAFADGPAESLPPVVLAGPSRDGPRERLVEFGRSLSREAARAGRRLALIASADQAHVHRPDGPYGYDPSAAEYDELIRSIVREDRLEDLLAIDPGLVERAKPDSLWQMLILHGAREGSGLVGEFLSYECPTYFGMLCATYR